MKKLLTILLLFLIAFKAVSDGLVLSHHHLLAGIFEFVYQAVFICGLIYFLTDNWKDLGWTVIGGVTGWGIVTLTKKALNIKRHKHERSTKRISRGIRQEIRRFQ